MVLANRLATNRSGIHLFQQLFRDLIFDSSIFSADWAKERTRYGIENAQIRSPSWTAVAVTPLWRGEDRKKKQNPNE
jgi:hypothetical protein